MAIYRNVSMSFWTDSKVVDDFTPEERYFYLYLFTNPHTNLCGCYEISKRQMANETGYNVETIEKLLNRLVNAHNVIRYSNDTKEVIILNWSKYNWTSSEKFMKSLMNQIELVKDADFKAFLEGLANGSDTVSIPYADRMDIRARAVTVTDTDTVSESNNKSNSLNTKSLDKEFESLWKLYPRKQGKVKAKQAYVKARKNGTTEEEVRRGIEAYVNHIKREKTEQRYIKHGSTFFTQNAWLDDYTTTTETDALIAWAMGEEDGQKTDSAVIDVDSCVLPETG